MNKFSNGFQTEFFDRDFKYIIQKTTNKNSYCKYKNGIFVVILGKNHTEDDAKKLVSKLYNQVKNEKKPKESLQIDFNKKTFRLFGDLYYFSISTNNKKIQIFRYNEEDIICSIDIRSTDRTYVINILENMFIYKRFFNKLTEIQSKWEKIIGLKKHKISIIKKTGSWASNSIKSSNIIYNFFLHNFSLEIIESVVIHELVHDLYQNHSKQFYDFVKKHCPNYKELHFKNQKHIFK